MVRVSNASRLKMPADWPPVYWGSRLATIVDMAMVMVSATPELTGEEDVEADADPATLGEVAAGGELDGACALAEGEADAGEAEAAEEELAAEAEELAGGGAELPPQAASSATAAAGAREMNCRRVMCLPSSVNHGEAAIDTQHLPSDVVGRRRTEEADSRRGFVRHSPAAERRKLRHHLCHRVLRVTWAWVLLVSVGPGDTLLTVIL